MTWFHKHDFRILHKGATEIIFACVEWGKDKLIEIVCDHEWELKERIFVSPKDPFCNPIRHDFLEAYERFRAGSTSFLHHCTKCSELRHTEMKGCPQLEAFR